MLEEYLKKTEPEYYGGSETYISMENRGEIFSLDMETQKTILVSI